jgi:hypothetical protein
MENIIFTKFGVKTTKIDQWSYLYVHDNSKLYKIDEEEAREVTDPSLRDWDRS